MRRFHNLDPVSELQLMLSRLTANGKLFVGIDPGITGAFGFVPSDGSSDPFAVDMPVIAAEVKSTIVGKRKMVKRHTFDDAAITAVLDPLIDERARVFIALERGQPRPEDGSKVAFMVGCAYRMWQLYFTAFALSYEEIMPAVWKKAMGLGGKDKNASRALAVKLCPATAPYLRAVGDHNRAEAILLARYSMMKGLGRV